MDYIPERRVIRRQRYTAPLNIPLGLLMPFSQSETAGATQLCVLIHGA